MGFYIKDVLIENNVFLAPLAGITDLPFRRICRELGAGMAYSEMISAKGLHYGNCNTKKLLGVEGEARPVGVQLFGSSPEILAETAAAVESQFDIIDINMGCPTPKIVKNGEGSALMLQPELVGAVVNAVSRAVKKPVTVKIRKGFDYQHLNAVETAKIAEANGAAAITVHGRTRSEFFSGQSDWNTVAEVKNAVKIPVIGNGDIDSPQAAAKMLRQTGCDAVMIGRAAQGDPWIFRRVRAFLDSGVLLEKPGFDEIMALALRHMGELVAYKGEFIGIREMRKFMCWYIKGVRGAQEARVKVNSAENAARMEEIISELLRNCRD